MYLDRVLFPIHALGPGARLGVWTKGCSKHCPGCANPELWSTVGAQDIPAAELAGILLRIHGQTPAQGLTLTGGDPLEQPEELLRLLRIIKPHIRDILLYTGDTLHEARRRLGEGQWEELRSLVAVLIDGPYIAERNDNASALIGSDNQTITFFDEGLRIVYAPYLARGRRVENIYMGQKLISVGIHNTMEGR